MLLENIEVMGTMSLLTMTSNSFLNQLPPQLLPPLQPQPLQLPPKPPPKPPVWKVKKTSLNMMLMKKLRLKLKAKMPTLLMRK